MKYFESFTEKRFPRQSKKSKSPHFFPKINKKNYLQDLLPKRHKSFATLALTLTLTHSNTLALTLTISHTHTHALGHMRIPTHTHLTMELSHFFFFLSLFPIFWRCAFFSLVVFLQLVPPTWSTQRYSLN